MAQIPIFGGSQQIGASSPVSIGSTTGAREGAEAVAGFGQAMFKVGNALDQVAKRAKDGQDKMLVSRAINMGRLAMLEKKAVEDNRGLQPGDRADGFSSVERFTEEVNPVLDQIAEQLAEPALQSQFYAGISDDLVTESTKVQAGSVVKREKTVPILRQENIMLKAEAVKKDLNLLPQMLGEVELDTANDPLVSEKDKPEMILKAKKQLGLAAIESLIAQGEAGDTSAFRKAKVLQEGPLGKMFTAEEAKKNLDNINSSEYNWLMRENAAYDRGVKLSDRAAKDRMEKRSSLYMQQLSDAANSDIKRAPVLKAIELDPAFDAFPAMRKQLIENRTFVDIGDDRYEQKVMTKAIKTKNYDQLIDTVNADLGQGALTVDRANKLIKSLRDFKEFSGRIDPTLLKQVDQWRDRIAKAGPGTMDINGIWRSENTQKSEAAQSAFMRAITDASAQGGLNGAKVDAIGAAVMRNNEYLMVKTIKGIDAKDSQTLKGISDVTAKLGKEYVSPDTSPKRKKEIGVQLKGLKEERDKLQKIEDLKRYKQFGPGKASKDFDDN